MNSNAVISSITLSPAPHLTWYYCLSDGIFFRIFPNVFCESKQEIRASLFCCKHRNRVLPVSCGRAADTNQTKMWCITRTLLFPLWENRCGVGLWIAVGQELKQADQTKRQVVREKNRNQKSWNFPVLCLIWSAIPRHHYSAAPLSPSLQRLLLLMLSVKPTMKSWLGDKANVF